MNTEAGGRKLRQRLSNGGIRVTRQRRDGVTFQLGILLVVRDPYQLVGRSLVGEARINTDSSVNVGN